jgi:hypothetical protein
MANKTNDPDLNDVQPGGDADATPTKPTPTETKEGEQQDDNIDDHGNKHGGGTVDQPT